MKRSLTDLLLGQPSDEWVEKGNCKKLSSEEADRIFFSSAKLEAQDICKACLVREECLEAALIEEAGVPMRFRFGIRGGLTGRERSRIQRAPCVSPA